MEQNTEHSIEKNENGQLQQVRTRTRKEETRHQRRMDRWAERCADRD